MIRLGIPVTRPSTPRILDRAIKLKLDRLTSCLPTLQDNILLKIKNNYPIPYPDIIIITPNKA